MQMYRTVSEAGIMKTDGSSGHADVVHVSSHSQPDCSRDFGPRSASTPHDPYRGGSQQQPSTIQIVGLWDAPSAEYSRSTSEGAEQITSVFLQPIKTQVMPCILKQFIKVLMLHTHIYMYQRQKNVQISTGQNCGSR